VIGARERWEIFDKIFVHACCIWGGGGVDQQKDERSVGN
jgi:hypothetical protein